MAGKVLVIEGDKALRHSLRIRLQAEGFSVVTVTDGQAALRAVSLERPDAIILELEPPVANGVSDYRFIRSDPDMVGVPILVLIGEGGEIDQIANFGFDADDFMSEPYNERELLARLKTLLRRTAMSPSPRMIRAGAIEIDLDRYVVKVGGAQVHFTSKEFDLLRALLEAKGRVLRRQVLLEKVWGYGESADFETRTIDVHIRRIRGKLGTEGRRILTVRNVGYRFEMALALLERASSRAVST